jgi:hypothetical protein
MYFPCTYLERLKKIMRNLSEESLPHLGFKPGHEITLDPQSVNVTNLKIKKLYVFNYSHEYMK